MFRSSRPSALNEPSPPPDESTRQDERLIFAAQKGDLAAFNALVTKHERAVFNLCWRMLGSVQEAEDASQETFLKAWTKSRSFSGGAFRPWLLRIASNCCYDILRSRARRHTDSLDLLEIEREPRWSSQTQVIDPEMHAQQWELASVLSAVLLQIPEDQRLAVTLCDIQDLPLGDAAQIMATSIGTLKSRLSRGRAKLRDLLLASETGRELLDRQERSSQEKA